MKIKKITKIALTEPVSVYDITVPDTENFKLAAGPIVHNSKDVADAVCGVAAYLLTRRSTWTQQPTFRGVGGLLLHGHRTGLGSVELEELRDEDIPTIGRRNVVRKRSVDRVKTRRRQSS